MMYDEFVELSGQEISYKQYSEIVEPMYIAVENMSKADFVKFITPSCKALVNENKKEIRRNQPTVFASNGLKTPNGCYFIGNYYKLVSKNVSIRTGKTTYTVRPLDDDEMSELRKHWDPWLGYDIDIYTNDEMTVIREVK